MHAGLRFVLVFLPLFAFVACAAVDYRLPQGKYHAKDESSIMVFRDDGVFGYKFAAKSDFFDEVNLPPMRAKIVRGAFGGLEVRDLQKDEPRFRIEWRPSEDSFDIVRIDGNGTLPVRARYEKKG